jgi:hypothetical protein
MQIGFNKLGLSSILVVFYSLCAICDCLHSFIYSSAMLNPNGSAICLATSLLYLCRILSMLSRFCVVIHYRVDGLITCE